MSKIIQKDEHLKLRNDALNQRPGIEPQQRQISVPKPIKHVPDSPPPKVNTQGKEIRKTFSFSSTQRLLPGATSTVSTKSLTVDSTKSSSAQLNSFGHDSSRFKPSQSVLSSKVAKSNSILNSKPTQLSSLNSSASLPKYGSLSSKVNKQITSAHSTAITKSNDINEVKVAKKVSALDLLFMKTDRKEEMKPVSVSNATSNTDTTCSIPAAGFVSKSTIPVHNDVSANGTKKTVVFTDNSSEKSTFLNTSNVSIDVSVSDAKVSNNKQISYENQSERIKSDVETTSIKNKTVTENMPFSNVNKSNSSGLMSALQRAGKTNLNTVSATSSSSSVPSVPFAATVAPRTTTNDHTVTFKNTIADDAGDNKMYIDDEYSDNINMYNNNNNRINNYTTDFYNNDNEYDIDTIRVSSGGTALLTASDQRKLQSKSADFENYQRRNLKRKSTKKYKVKAKRENNDGKDGWKQKYSGSNSNKYNNNNNSNNNYDSDSCSDGNRHETTASSNNRNMLLLSDGSDLDENYNLTVTDLLTNSLNNGSSANGAHSGGSQKEVLVSGGLSSWGLDPLDLSLQVIAGDTANIPSGSNSSNITTSTAINPTVTIAAPEKEISKTTINKTTTINLKNITSNLTLRTNDTSKKKIRGLDKDYKQKTAKINKNSTILYSIKTNNNNIKNTSGGTDRSSSSKLVTTDPKEVQFLLEKYAPSCPGHQMTAKLCTVKKSGANKGKQFYVCTFPQEQQCKFFMWAENNPELIKASLGDNTTATNNNNNNSSNSAMLPSPSLTPATVSHIESYITFAVTTYQTKLYSLSKTELVAEIKKCNERNKLIHKHNNHSVNSNGKSSGNSSRGGNGKGGRGSRNPTSTDNNTNSDLVKLTVSGSNEELIEKLTLEALRVMTSQYTAVQSTADNVDINATGSANTGDTRNNSSSNSIVNISAANDNVVQLSDSDDDVRPSATVPEEQHEALSSHSNDVMLSDSDCDCERKTVNGALDAVKEHSVPPLSSDAIMLKDVVNNDRTVNDSSSSNSDDLMDSDIDSSGESSSGDQQHSSDESVHIGTKRKSATANRITKTVAPPARRLTRNANNNTRQPRKNNSSDDEDSPSEDSAVEDSESNSDSDNSEIQSNRDRKEAFAATTKIRKKTNSSSQRNSGSNNNNNVSVDNTDPVLQVLRDVFGFTQLRDGQRWAMERSLQGRSSLLVLPTGSGKSLTYMLPSISLPGLTIVVSPLLSLMNDQLKKLPVQLPGACFSGALTSQRAVYLCDSILKGFVKILYVSPERLCTPAFHKLMKLLTQQARYNSDSNSYTSPVSLLCIDEAHCLSQWSYNFRPAFLRIKREIQNINPSAVLALTATASVAIQQDIMRHLNIDPTSGLLALSSRRDNLLLSSRVIENENEKRAVILKLVKNPITTISSNTDTANLKCNAVSKKQSKAHTKAQQAPLTIVYVWRRDEAESLGEFLKGNNVDTVVYHAGMDSDARERSQKLFDRGTVSCVVATVAFGMGIDKADVRQIIHNSMPKSIENYVQEIGRAGRDGDMSSCALFLHRDDVIKQHSLSHSSVISKVQIAGLLTNVFRLDSDGTIGSTTTATLTPTVAISLASIEKNLDVSSAALETILSLLELPPFQMVTVLGTYYDTIQGRFRVTNQSSKNRLDTLIAGDILCAGLAKLNEIKPEKKQQSSYDVYDGDSNKDRDGGEGRFGGLYDSGDTYGLGNGDYNNTTQYSTNNSYTTNNNGNTYGDNILEFRVSRLSLSLECDLTVEEVSNGLYALQKNGLLEYTLTNNCIYCAVKSHIGFDGGGNSNSSISTNSNGVSGGGSDSDAKISNEQQVPSFSAFLQLNNSTNTPTFNASYYHWIWLVAGKLHTILHSINALAADRIVNMWRIGNTIAKYSAIASNKDSNKNTNGNSNSNSSSGGSGGSTTDQYDPSEVQSALQQFICYAMEQTNTDSTSNTTSNITTNSGENETTDPDSEVTTMEVENENQTSDSLSVYDQILLTYHNDVPSAFENSLPLLHNNNSSSSASNGSGGMNSNSCSNSDQAATLTNKQSDIRRKFSAEVQALTTKDERLKQLVDTILRNAKHSEFVKNKVVPLRQLRNELLVLYLSKLLHGLATCNMTAAAWKYSESWGKYKEFCYEDVLSAVEREMQQLQYI